MSSKGSVYRLLSVVLLGVAAAAVAAAQTPTSSRSPHGNLNIPCQNCHTTDGWKPIRAIPEFDHSQTKFPLRGLHQNVACTQCHIKPVFSNVGSKCADCHADIHKRQFGASCEQCHTVNGWNVSVKQINDHLNRFPLLGAHATLDCDSCHKGAATGQFQGLSTTCYSCHAQDYRQVAVPNHVTGKFPITCEECHGFENWLGAKFDHSTVGFPLTNSHAVPPRECTDCHINNNFNLSSTACVSCHLKDYQGTTNPNHVAGKFPQTCDQCHNTTSWSNASFNHNLVGFALTGMHTVPPRQCADCHVNNNYNLTSTACVSCHLKDYQSTTNPSHVAQNFPQTCDQCHSTTSWLGASFNHSSTGFALSGMHAVPPRQCTDCHVNNNYNLTTSACVSCHLKDYQSTTNPNHVQSGFPQTCEQCHDTIQWTDATFNHSSTGFALTGMHTVPPRQCADCHINGNYKLNSTACVTCHQNDYNGAVSPVNHISAGFPTTCELCHDTNLWTDGVFNHNNTPFPLTGMHTVPPRLCADCHVNNNYTTLPTTCVGCHQADYNATTNPGHAAQPQFFPTTCQNCHNTTNWLQATFNHAQYTPFPTNHGNANGVCSTCHINSNDYSVFQCTQCHSKSQTDPQHQGVGGYVYNSVNCYQCHRNGQGGG